MVYLAGSELIRRTFVGLAAVALLAIGLTVVANPVHATTTFTVNSTGDEPDLNSTNDVCTISASRIVCTLRAAIEQANATAGPDTINFDIPDDPGAPGNEVRTIRPASALPVITEQATINGYSQPGASPNTLEVGDNAVLKVELSGAIAGVVSGLHLRAANSVVKGLVINDFPQQGVFSGAMGNRIEGNYIGTDATGTQDLGNGGYGVEVGPPGGNTIGGAVPAARNLISGNDIEGIYIGSSSNTVAGNYIGTEKNGTSTLGNTGTGVLLQGPDNNVAANTIAFNDGDGIKIEGNNAGNNGIRSNSIFSNTGLGIDLFPVGVTPNDPNDADTGPNGLQNFPVLTSATSSGGSTNIQGTFNGFPNDTVIVQFFASPAADPSGFGEGRKYLGQTTVTTDGNGDIGFSVSGSSLPSATAGQAVTATASTMGGTSEFSEAMTINTAPEITNPHPKPGSQARTRKPAIGATVHDAQTNLSESDIKLFVDGRARSFSYDRATDRLRRPSNKLSLGRHTLKIVATDAQGLQASRKWGFKVVR